MIALLTSCFSKTRRYINKQTKMSIAPGNELLRKNLDRLRSSPNETLLLDGGTGEELFLRGVKDDRKIWSATAIVNGEYHGILEKVHRSFIDAGSQAITTNSYGITPGVGFTDGDEVKRLVEISGEIARRAVTDGQKSIALVLGSLGPLVESYRPDLIMKHDDGVKKYKYPIEGLYPFVDIFLAETMSISDEAFQVIDALSIFYQGQSQNQGELAQHPLLISFTLRSDGKVRSGESVTEIIPKLIHYAHNKPVELIGVLFNCCEPEAISKALQEIRSCPKIHCYLYHPPDQANQSSSTSSSEKVTASQPPRILLGAYANRLTPVHEDWALASSEEAQAMREDLLPDDYWREFVDRWRGHKDVANNSTVSFIGGCCGIGPSHISFLSSKLKNSSH
mmetsp:Transcript_8527/g.12252  ORF Transcript_8527/g.12252 Transcript_8527/m.12252 type:complete len:394 (-) Transcript_8527:26-1207(-)